MSSVLDIFKTDPYFVNEEGTKWWIDHSTTEYAQKEDKHGVSLNVRCWFIETKEGMRTRVLINSRGEIIEEDQILEQMAVKIDVRKFLKRSVSEDDAEGIKQLTKKKNSIRTTRKFTR